MGNYLYDYRRYDKIEILNSLINSKDKEIILIRSEKERYEVIIKEKDEYVFKLRADVEDEKKELNQRIEEFNRRYHEGHDKFLTDKGKKEFFVRHAASTLAYDISEAYAYINKHWN